MRKMLSSILALVFLTAVVGPALGEDGQPRPVAQLVKALEDSDPSVRIEAAEDLSKLGPGAVEAMPSLLEALVDDNADVRSAAAQALGAMGRKAVSAAPALIEALEDDGVTASGKPVWVAIASALGSIGPKIVPELIVALDHEHPRVCTGAAAALHDVGPEANSAVEKLIKVIQKDDPRVRRAAIFALMGIGPEAAAAVPVLTKTLAHEDFHTQYWACRGLGAIGPAAKTATADLIRLTKEGVASSRRNAAAALGQIGPGIGEEGVAALAEALQEFSEPVREQAAIALGRLGPFAKSAAPALESVLKKRTISARVPAALALWLITGDTEMAVPVLVEQLDNFNWGEAAAEALGQIGPEAGAAVPALIVLLKSEDPLIRIQVTSLLSKMGPASKFAIQALEPLKNDPDEEVRKAALEAIERIGSL